jgi:hypothetical protein
MCVLQMVNLHSSPSRGTSELTNHSATLPIPSGAAIVPPPSRSTSVKSGTKQQPLLRTVQEMHKESPSTCHPRSCFSLLLALVPPHSGEPKFTIKESFHILLHGATRSSPPRISHIAPQAFGAKSLTRTLVCSAYWSIHASRSIYLSERSRGGSRRQR